MASPDGGKRRRRPHPAASSRIFAAGLSSAAAFGMVAGMGLAAGTGPDAAPGDVAMVPAGRASGAVATTPVPAPREVVVIRRHWIPMPSGAATPAGPAVSAAPVPASAPAGTARAPQPAPRRPITRSRGS